MGTPVVWDLAPDQIAAYALDVLGVATGLYLFVQIVPTMYIFTWVLGLIYDSPFNIFIVGYLYQAMLSIQQSQIMMIPIKTAISVLEQVHDFDFYNLDSFSIFILYPFILDTS